MTHAVPSTNRAIAAIYDAVIDEGRRTDALMAIAECVGVAGAGYMLVDKYSDRVQTISIVPEGRASHAELYRTHYAAIDPYRATRQRAETGSWLRVTELFPSRFLDRNEWYNDCLIPSGVNDILGGKLHESASHTFLISLYREIGASGDILANPAALKVLSLHLRNAARLSAGLLDAGFDAALNYEAVDGLQTGVIFVDEEGRIIWINRTAEAFVRRGDGIVGEAGRITSRRIAEAARLARLIAAATARPPSAGCTLIRRDRAGAPYVVRIVPIGVALERFDRPTAMLAITSPGDALATPEEVSHLFGLSPAEGRLATAIAQGQQPAEYARAHQLQISTVRTQLSSVLRKLSARRQTDIVRMLAGIPSTGPVRMTPPASGGALAPPAEHEAEPVALQHQELQHLDM